MCSSRPVSCERPLCGRTGRPHGVVSSTEEILQRSEASIEHARRDADAFSLSMLMLLLGRLRTCRSSVRRLHSASLRSKKFSGITAFIGQCMIDACWRTSYGIVSPSPSFGFCSVPRCSSANGFSFEEEALFGYPPKIVHTALIPIRTCQGFLPNSTKKGSSFREALPFVAVAFMCVSAWQQSFPEQTAN